jgi:uncharacterized protein (DUF1697 family)
VLFSERGTLVAIGAMAGLLTARYVLRWAVTTYVALLRAVNLGAHNKVSMADLSTWLGTVGASRVRTLLQSGNAIFESSHTSAYDTRTASRGKRTRAACLETDFMLRSSRAWKELVAANPFPAQARTDPGHLVVLFLKAAPKTARRRHSSGCNHRARSRALQTDGNCTSSIRTALAARA